MHISEVGANPYYLSEAGGNSVSILAMQRVGGRGLIVGRGRDLFFALGSTQPSPQLVKGAPSPWVNLIMHFHPVSRLSFPGAIYITSTLLIFMARCLITVHGYLCLNCYFPNLISKEGTLKSI